MTADPRRTLLFLLRPNQVLLAMKKRGFGAGRWNGTGGKPNPGESMLEAAVRETQEEIGVTPFNVKERGQIDFIFADGMRLEVSLYSTNYWHGKPHETEEMRPRWYKFNRVPYKRMWPDDKLWLPALLKGYNVSGPCYFSDMDTITGHDLRLI